MSHTAVVNYWLETYYDYLPELRVISREQLPKLANYFSSYLVSSFDLVEDTTDRPRNTCYCEICRYFAHASILKPKKLSRKDKNEAKVKKQERLLDIAAAANLNISIKTTEKLVQSPELAFDIATTAYIQSILDRMNGKEAGPYALALWREIAWRNGSPKKDFHLEAQSIMASENNIQKQLKAL